MGWIYLLAVGAILLGSVAVAQASDIWGVSGRQYTYGNGRFVASVYLSQAADLSLTMPDGTVLVLSQTFPLSGGPEVYSFSATGHFIYSAVDTVYVEAIQGAQETGKTIRCQVSGSGWLCR